jgi:sugar lactone lactonase YvrE
MLLQMATLGFILAGLAAAPTRADIIYASNGLNDTIEKYASNGSRSVFASSGLTAPHGVAFDSAGNLFAANYADGSIEKLTPAAVGSVFSSAGLLQFPFGLAFDSTGNLYASDFVFNRIIKFTPGGVGSTFASSGMNSPTALAFDRAGNLYAANYGDSTIEKFTPGGVGSVFANTGLSQPEGLAFDTAGNLYAANSSTIEKLTPAGAGSVFASSGVSRPWGLAFDSAGNLYAANIVSETIEKFTTNGSGSVFASGSGAAFLAFTDNAGVPLKLPNQLPEPSGITTLIIVGCLACRRARRRPTLLWPRGMKLRQRLVIGSLCLMACQTAFGGQDGLPFLPPLGAGSGPLSSQYGYDDGSDEAVVGVTSPEAYSFSQTVWMNHFVVQTGKETLTGVAVTFGSRSAGSNGLQNGGPAQIFILSDPNGDGNPSDAQVLRVANTTIDNVDTGSFNRLAITPITLPVGTSFFVGAMVMNLPLDRYPAAIDTGYTDIFGLPEPAGHASDAWVAAGQDGSFGLTNLSTAEYFGNPGTLIGPGYAGPFMVRAETVVVPEPQLVAVAFIAAIGRRRPLRKKR